jgi:serine/threonine-protein kinase HipA
MAFNAVCGNGDDHPRNHGLVHEGGRWRLAEAFDIAPYTTFSGTLAMAVTRDGRLAATTANLLKDCAVFGYTVDDARRYLGECRALVAQAWPEEVRACGHSPDSLPTPTGIWLDTDSTHAIPR